jgi:alpha-tubulin suppressor-like RCC1 family protein
MSRAAKKSRDLVNNEKLKCLTFNVTIRHSWLTEPNPSLAHFPMMASYNKLLLPRHLQHGPRRIIACQFQALLLCWLLTFPAQSQPLTVVGWGVSTVAIPPSWLTNVTAISAGGYHSLALRTDGTVVAWGGGSVGQLNVPDGLNNAIAISAGYAFSLALRDDGTVIGWGQNFDGAFDIPQDLTNAVAISAAGAHGLALTSDERVVGWPGQLPANLTNVVAIAAGMDFDMALKSDGTVVCWGSYSFPDRAVQAYSPPDLTNVVAISAGQSHSLAIKADGTIVGWGADWAGETQIPSGLTNVVAISAGDRHSMAIKTDGTVADWGEIGDLPEPAYLNNVIAVAAGGQSYLALLGTREPHVTVQPFDRTCLQGAGTTFAVAAAGDRPMTYQWQFNGNEISGATNASFSVVGLQPADAGSYGVLISNKFGVTLSRQAKLSLFSGPKQPLVIKETDSWTLNPAVPFSHQILVDDSDVPATSLLFTPASPFPAGAALSSSGLFTWTPGLNQGLTTNTIAIWVGDGFSSVSKQITVTVNRTNTPPILPVQSDRIVFGSAELVVTNTGFDPDIPGGALNYELVIAPLGATIDSSGVIRWTPDVTQDPSTNLFVTVATDNGIPPMPATNSFTVIAFAADQPPTLNIPDSSTIAEGQAFSFQASATDPDTGQNSLIFTIWPGAPFGAVISTTGLFSWTPTEAQAPSINPVTICVSDGTSTVCKTIQIVVNEDPLEILSPPRGGSFGIGTNVRLSVVADGATEISYQWQYNGTNLTGSTQPTLTVSNAQPADSGFYSVTVSNSSGVIVTSPVLVSIVAIATWGYLDPLDARALVPAGLTNVSSIAAGQLFDLALKPDGTVVAWGYNFDHQLDVPTDLTNVIAVAAGASSHSLALRADGTVVSWGTQFPTNVPVPAGLSNVVAIDVGGQNNLALKSDGTVVAWGAHDTSYQFPSIAPPGLTNVVAIGAGSGWDLVLKSDGAVADWDDSNGGFLPTPVDLTNVVAVSAGSAVCLVLKADGTVEAWRPHFDLTNTLNVPEGLTNVVAISMKGDHGLVVFADGTVTGWGWGSNATVIVDAPPSLPNVVAVSGGLDQSAALLRDGSPRVTVQPWDRSVPEGGNVGIGAKVVGVQSLNYQWKLNGADVAGATNDTYTVSKATSSDAGVYSLTVSNRIGTIATRQAKLIVTTPAPVHTPPVLAQPLDYNVNVGQMVTFTGSVTEDDSTRKLTFSLDSAPAGAQVSSDAGIFTWRPPLSASDTTNSIVLRVTDDGVPPLSDFKLFTVTVNPVEPVGVSAVVENDGKFHLRITGSTGPDYIVQASDDLTHWVNIQTNSAASMPFDFVDSQSGSATHRFYRVRLGP